VTARAIASLAGLAVAPAACAETLVVSLGAQQISIRSNYTGAAVSVVGVVERDAGTVPRAADYDAVVTVRGPRGAVTVRRKEQVGPFWFNRAQRKYIAIPAFITVLSNRGLDAIVQPGLRERHHIGVETLIPEQSLARGPEAPDFRDALVRLRQREGLFLSNAAAVRFITPNVLQARVEIPGRAPLGRYDVDVAVFADGALLARQEKAFTVTKAGVEQAFSMAARDSGMLYGLVTSFMALAFGWIASAVFRRD
jgi:uncharacterized protein (TIGR02186 family)